jgi:hypothetical protein
MTDQQQPPPVKSTPWVLSPAFMQVYNWLMMWFVLVIPICAIVIAIAQWRR